MSILENNQFYKSTKRETSFCNVSLLINIFCFWCMPVSFWFNFSKINRPNITNYIIHNTASSRYPDRSFRIPSRRS